MRIGTRGSALALAQAELVAGLLGAGEIVPILTTGDRGEAGGDKSRWITELERALLAGEIDLAVHSAKDVPSELADGLELFGAPARAAAEDVLCVAGAAETLPVEGASEMLPGAAAAPAQSAESPRPELGVERLPAGARIATSSIRRAAQLRAARADVDVVAVRGNVDTRLRKLAASDFDALVLARAGLQRLDREREITAVLDPARFVPAPGQGTLALEGRAADERTRAAVAAIVDAQTFTCLRAERAVAHALGASCNTPLGVHALGGAGEGLRLRAWVGLPDGSQWLADVLHGEPSEQPEQLGQRMAERLRSAGAAELLTEAGRHAPFGANPRFGQRRGAGR
jgi:hydroxymethylbilane synthase